MNDNTKQTDKIVLKPTGRFTSDNVGDIERSFLKTIGDTEAPDLVVDMEDVEYISSAGLRLLMSMSKKACSMSIINAIPEVYDVFSITGLTEIMDVKRAYKKLSVEGLPIIGEGVTATVYRLDQERIVKVYKKEIQEEALLREQYVTKKAFLAGVPTMITFDTVKVGDWLGTVYEAFNFDTLESIYVKASDEVRKELTKKHAGAVRAMCEVVVKPEDFSSFKSDMFSKLEKAQARLDEQTLHAYREMLNAIPNDHTFVHGDCHMGNLMMDAKGELKVIDLGISGYGNPIFSLSAICLYRLFAEMFPENIYQQKAKMTAAEGETLYRRFVVAYYQNVTDSEIETIQQGIYLYCCLFSSLNYVGTPLVTDETFRLLSGKVVDAWKAGFDCSPVFAKMRAKE